MYMPPWVWWEEATLVYIPHPTTLGIPHLPCTPGYTDTRVLRRDGRPVGSGLSIIMVNVRVFTLSSRKCDVWYAFSHSRKGSF